MSKKDKVKKQVKDLLNEVHEATKGGDDTVSHYFTGNEIASSKALVSAFLDKGISPVGTIACLVASFGLVMQERGLHTGKYKMLGFLLDNFVNNMVVVYGKESREDI